MTYQIYPKIGLIGPQTQSIDLALELAAHMANKSENYSKESINLDEITDFHSIRTPVWDTEIISVEFKNLDSFQITMPPSSRKALSLSKKFPEVVLSIETESNVLNVLNGQSLTEADDHDILLEKLMRYWDIETRN